MFLQRVTPAPNTVLANASNWASVGGLWGVPTLNANLLNESIPVAAKAALSVLSTSDMIERKKCKSKFEMSRNPHGQTYSMLSPWTNTHYGKCKDVDHATLTLLQWKSCDTYFSAVLCLSIPHAREQVSIKAVSKWPGGPPPRLDLLTAFQIDMYQGGVKEFTQIWCLHFCWWQEAQRRQFKHLDV